MGKKERLYDDKKKRKKKRDYINTPNERTGDLPKIKTKSQTKYHNQLCNTSNLINVCISA